ncbi:MULTISPECIES: DUF5408 family protein [Helicobacter]|uniref:DUF5408 family protein n=1 Tax=Helicobacter ibis TaxID=2962633 RepID=A0ABT4VDK7_9HELI|nr:MULTISPECIES: DUF5408 family protein [Helicobacter]MDA3966611.1 DUF5408 family protein [Helicobacter sp. WB40]MDA3968773.1 DUF5408 family protein [Helicobacter ibis]
MEYIENIAKRAIKIAIISCVITTIFAFISLWIMLNQITATANLVKEHRELQKKVELLEQNQKVE